MKYDDTTPIAPAVAEIIGCSAKNKSKIAKVMKQAKRDLNITSKARNLPPEIKAQIYNYVVEKYSQSVEIKTHDADEIISQTVETNSQNDVERYSQDVETITQDDVDIVPQSVEIETQGAVEKNSQTVEIIKQVLDVTLQNNVITDVSVRSESVKKNSQVDKLFSHTDNFNNVRIGFYIERNGKRERQVIALDGYLINALGSIGVLKKDVPAWVQAQVDDWTAFDDKLPITRQVKYLIMREVVKGLSGSDELFHAPIND